jgi:sRNA-binding carbon storage regulator CsrA
VVGVGCGAHAIPAASLDAWRRTPRWQWSAEAGGPLVTVLATAAVPCRRLLDSWPGSDQPPATPSASVAVAVWCGGYRPGLVAAALGFLAGKRLQGGLPMVFDLSAGDVVRIGEAVTLTVLAVEEDLIRVALESPEDGPGAVRLTVLAVEEGLIRVGLESP